MRRFYTSALATTILLVGGNSVNADFIVPQGTQIHSSTTIPISTGLTVSGTGVSGYDGTSQSVSYTHLRAHET